MTSGNPETTEQNPLVPMQTGENRERLAKFVSELWAQRRHLTETQRRIDKGSRMKTTSLFAKTLNSLTELPLGYSKANAMRALT